MGTRQPWLICWYYEGTPLMPVKITLETADIQSGDLYKSYYTYPFGFTAITESGVSSYFQYAIFFLVGWDLRHQVLRPLLAYCTAPDDR
jgi:hypothetical protein